MQLQIDVNLLKSNIFLELLDVFKKDNLINSYKIMDNYNKDEQNILSDLKLLGNTLTDAKNGKGYKTNKEILIDEI